MLICYIFTVYFLRLIYLLIIRKPCKKPEKILLIFGSGGHTTELLMMFKDYDFSAMKKIYFLRASSDKTSEKRILLFVEKNNVFFDYFEIYFKQKKTLLIIYYNCLINKKF